MNFRDALSDLKKKESETRSKSRNSAKNQNKDKYSSSDEEKWELDVIKTKPSAAERRISTKGGGLRASLRGSQSTDEKAPSEVVVNLLTMGWLEVGRCGHMGEPDLLALKEIKNQVSQVGIVWRTALKHYSNTNYC